MCKTASNVTLTSIINDITNYKNLLAWQKAMLLLKGVYVITKLYPKEELFALTAQTKRSAISVPSNIAVGCGRRTENDTSHFLHRARGTFYELETQLNIALMVEYISEEKFNALSVLLDQCLRILNGLITRYEKDDLL